MRESGALLLDTGVWIAYFRGEDPLLDRVRQGLIRRRIVLSSVAVLELLAGGRRRLKRGAVRDLVATFQIADLFVHPTWQDLSLAGEVLGDYATGHARCRVRRTATTY